MSIFGYITIQKNITLEESAILTIKCKIMRITGKTMTMDEIVEKLDKIEELEKKVEKLENFIEEIKYIPINVFDNTPIGSYFRKAEENFNELSQTEIDSKI